MRRAFVELIATPGWCFIWALFLILLGGALASPFIVCRPKLDSSGLPLLNDDGSPIIEIDTLADILAHWPENLCVLGAVIFAVLGVLVWWRRLRQVIARAAGK
jgi:hypothetical protein